MRRPEDLSKLPLDPAYWSALEARVLAAVRRDHPMPTPRAWHAPLGRAVWALSAAAAAAALAVSFIPRDAAATTAAGPLPSLIAPPRAEGESLSALFQADAPPVLADLLLHIARGGRR